MKYLQKFGWQFNQDIEREDMIYGQTAENKFRGYLNNLKIMPDELKDKRVLIAGVGAGKEIKYFTAFGAKVTGLDLFTEKAERTCKGLKNVKIVKADIKCFRPKHKYDYIISVGVLHHTPNPKVYFNALVKNLKTSGKIYVWLYQKQRLRLLRLLKTWNWTEYDLYIFSKTITLLSYPFYRLIRKKPFSSLTLHVFDALCCEYQWTTPKKEVEEWFTNNHLICLNEGEGYFGHFSK